MNYRDCLSYLARIQSLGIKFGLDNVRAVMSELGDPQKDFKTIQVAGSNGKGSVCAMVTRILTSHGIKCGLFTSPHLVDIEERIRIGDDLIHRTEFCRLLEFLKQKIQNLIDRGVLKTPPTYFELMTLLAVLYFKESCVDMAVLEVGMGGRFDATTAVDPVVTAITTISGEHQEYLGESLSQIAFEKAGIIKPGVPVVSGVIDEDPKRVIQKRAEELKAPFFDVFGNNTSFMKKKIRDRFIFDYILNDKAYRYSTCLPGVHQGKNAAIAIGIAEQIHQRCRKLDKEKIIKGIESAEWPGRLEIISRKPLIIMDGAHNIEGAKALREYLDEFTGSVSVLIFAVMKGKKIKEISDILFPKADRVIVTRFRFYRAASPEEILSETLHHKHKITCEPDPVQAFRSALCYAGRTGSILIAGSLYIVGEIKKAVSLNNS